MYVYKLVVLFLLGVITVVYTNCGSPFSTQSQLVWKSNVYGGSDEASYEAFRATVYPITRANCAGCHETQTPKHASPDYKVAHDDIIMGSKVNFANIPNSRLVKKLRDENHNCWSSCDADADEMQVAIEDWNEAIKDSGAGTTVAPPTVQTLKTSQTLSMAQELANPANAPKSPTIEIDLATANLTAPMVRASNVYGPYLHVPDNDGQNLTLANNDNSAGIATFNIKLPAAGTYRVWGYVVAPDANTNAFYVGIAPRNNPTAFIGGIRTWDITANANPTWNRQNNTFAVNAGGDYTLTLRERKDGTEIYRIFVTADNNFVSTDVNAFLGVSIAFDVSALMGLSANSAKFVIDVSDYDAYTYLLANPRIVAPGRNIRVKNIRPMLNNVWSAQNSTYTNVDKVATPADPSLSGFPMIALKDQGASVDKWHFEFEILEVYTGTVNNASLQSFQTSVYAISRANCTSCHSSSRPHASPDPLTAHDYVLNANLVDFNNPANSLIANKIRNGHQGISAAQGSNLATQYEQAIVQWRTGRGGP